MIPAIHLPMPMPKKGAVAALAYADPREERENSAELYANSAMVRKANHNTTCWRSFLCCETGSDLGWMPADRTPTTQQSAPKARCSAASATPNHTMFHINLVPR